MPSKKVHGKGNRLLGFEPKMIIAKLSQSDFDLFLYLLFKQILMSIKKFQFK